MNRLRNCAAVCSIAVLSVIAGCKGPDNVMAPHTTADDPLPTGAYPEIVLLDGLERSLVRQAVGVVDVPEGHPMTVRTTIRSVVDQTTPIEYRFLFFDGTGKSLTRNPVWRQHAIQGRARATLEANALVMGAERFEMEIRRPR